MQKAVTNAGIVLRITLLTALQLAKVTIATPGSGSVSCGSSNGNDGGAQKNRSSK